MTKQELKEISQEIDSISKQVALLDPRNAIESQERRRLFHRWDFLDYQLEVALISFERNNSKWHVANSGLKSSDLPSRSCETVKQTLRIIS